MRPHLALRVIRTHAEGLQHTSVNVQAMVQNPDLASGTWADLGTGSGALAIATARHLGTTGRVGMRHPVWGVLDPSQAVAMTAGWHWCMYRL